VDADHYTNADSNLDRYSHANRHGNSDQDANPDSLEYFYERPDGHQHPESAADCSAHRVHRRWVPGTACLR
jgi:hypothetical protein